MSWETEIAELERRRELARGMGGPEGIARQHANGKLTVRERIERLADPGSWREFRSLVGSAVFALPCSLSGTSRVDCRRLVWCLPRH